MKESTKMQAKRKPRVTEFSYTRPEELRRFVTEQGMIIPRDKTGLTQKQQRRLEKSIKRARHLALLPFTQTV